MTAGSTCIDGLPDRIPPGEAVRWVSVIRKSNPRPLRSFTLLLCCSEMNVLNLCPNASVHNAFCETQDFARAFVPSCLGEAQKKFRVSAAIHAESENSGEIRCNRPACVERLLVVYETRVMGAKNDTQAGELRMLPWIYQRRGGVCGAGEPTITDELVAAHLQLRSRGTKKNHGTSDGRPPLRDG